MQREPVDPTTKGMAAIALAVAAGTTLFPRAFVRLYGFDPDTMGPAGRFGWRLFATRNLYLSTQALRGDPRARDAFLPVQVLDQGVFWHGFATRAMPRSSAVLAAATSGVIIALDLRRRLR